MKNAALRLIRNEERMAETARVNNVIANNAKQRLSQSGSSPGDNNSFKIAGGCSGYNINTDLITQASTGTVTAALQLQQGGTNQPTNSDIPSSSFSDRPMANLLSGAQSTDRSLPVTIQYDVTITTNSFSNSSAEGGVILGDVQGARLAIESDNSIGGFLTVTSCLLNLQPLPTEFNNGLQVVTENIDSWRTNLVTRIKLYSSTIADLKTTTNATSYACDINARTNSSITARIDSLAEEFNQLDIRTSRNHDNIMLVCGMIDQLRARSDSQFSSLSKQLQSLRQSPHVVPTVHTPTPSVDSK